MQLIASRIYNDFGTTGIDRLYRRRDGSFIVEELPDSRFVEIDRTEALWFLNWRTEELSYARNGRRHQEGKPHIESITRMLAKMAGYLG